MNMRTPLPLASRAICKAAHSKKPISSKISEIKIIATKDKVAFQTIPVTVPTSLNVTTRNNSARTAPPIAVQPIDSPLGCQITNNNVSKNIKTAKKTCMVPPNYQNQGIATLIN
ncbi:hypothetical protein FD21_GL001326 [Liquorilactobacillus vini DSM 20605]|uniref:Uncharacterized protein n=2 Tax=Liquorilactobacillus TaxID=2767888 RepID=A0A0R2CHZ6_9LACO|nr:hypothetical protein FD20_GL002300 [Liquorilactobacillus uvarum DSM 19971]KRM87299.1 hypothetical protein FD21_GL001326 [Liquorilactobacillus vini DSM 20605]